MSKTNWADIKSDYVTTTMTLAEVQAKWDIKRGTLSARATRENWNQAKQQFAADLEQQRRDKRLAKLAAEKEQFDDAVFNIAKGQLGVIARRLSEPGVNGAEMKNWTTALKTVHQVGNSAYPHLKPDAECR